MTRTRRRSRSRALRDARAALFWVAALVALVLVIWAAAHPLVLGTLGTLGALVVAAACWRIARPRLERNPGPGRRPVIRARAERVLTRADADTARRARATSDAEAAVHAYRASRAETTRADLERQLAERAADAERRAAEHEQALARLAQAARQLEAMTATIEGLRADLADARASAVAAWDAAAERPPAPRPAADDAPREHLLGSPHSGARPLVGGDQ